MLDFAEDHPLAFFILNILLLSGVMVGLLRAGMAFGKRHLKLHPEAKHDFGVIDGAVFGLFGLLLAFSFSAAVDGFQKRRYLIEDEAKHVGTTYAMLDMLPDPGRKEIQSLFKKFLDIQINAYGHVHDRPALYRDLEQMSQVGKEIFRKTELTCREAPPSPLHQVLLDAMNQMMHAVQARRFIIGKHPPIIIGLLLLAFTFVCAYLAGFAMAETKQESWTHTIAFSFAMALTLTVILDLELPRAGLIRVSSADQMIIDTRKAMD